LTAAEVHVPPFNVKLTVPVAPAINVTSQVTFSPNPNTMLDGEHAKVGVMVVGGGVDTANDAAPKSVWSFHATLAVSAVNAADGSRVQNVTTVPLACAITGLLQSCENFAATPEATEALVENCPYVNVSL
jgi:hypothetical protein